MAAVPTARIVSDLRAAAGELRRCGWTTGRYRDPDTGCMCLVGAIRYAIAGTTHGESMSREEHQRADGAEREIRDHLRSHGVNVFDPIEWNDVYAHSGDEVAELLERVAEHLATLLPDDQAAAADPAPAAGGATSSSTVDGAR